MCKRTVLTMGRFVANELMFYCQMNDKNTIERELTVS